MKRFRSSVRLLRLSLTVLAIFEVGAVLVALEMPAQAYVDPGSGYVLLQVVGSMAVGALYYLRHRVRKILWMLRGKGEPETLEAPEVSPAESPVADLPKGSR